MIGRLLRLGLGATLLVMLLLVVAVAITAASLPGFDELQRSPNGQSIVVRAADGSPLASLGPSFGRWLSYDQIPDTMKDAIVSVEDRRFRWHPGVDPLGVGRAVYVNATAGRNRQGASTITQQLARNVFLTNDRTFARKGREMVLALALERRFTKNAILELYLNRVYFGGGAYGIDAASRKFFGHPATALSLPEAAVIAGLVKAPSRYAPSADADAARGRARVVVATMADAGAIPRSTAAQVNLAALRFAPEPAAGNVRYYTDWALGQLEGLTDERVEPLEVFTTLDPRMQAAAELAVRTQPPAGAQGAIVAMTRDGAVKAMVGGRDYIQSIYNRAVAARRQPGSSWKLFDYLAAIEDGVTPDDVVRDEPVTIGGWSPRNSNGRFTGETTVRRAFAESINTVAVQLAARVGFDTVAAMARRFGITSPIDPRPAMALGASDASLIEMTAAYASIANQGIATVPYAITRVTTGRGRQLYTREADTPRVLVAPYVAARMTDLLRAAVETGTGRAAEIGRPLAGKTGTTSSNKDGWFIGFTPELVAGVWMGRDDARAVPGLAGGRAPARAFAVFMSRAVSGTTPTDLTTDVALPDQGLEPDERVYGLGGEQAGTAPDGTPTTLAPDAPASPDEGPPPPPPENQVTDRQKLDERWLDGVLGPDDPPPR